jgi:hypothetical protein
MHTQPPLSFLSIYFGLGVRDTTLLPDVGNRSGPCGGCEQTGSFDHFRCGRIWNPNDHAGLDLLVEQQSRQTIASVLQSDSDAALVLLFALVVNALQRGRPSRFTAL